MKYINLRSLISSHVFVAFGHDNLSWFDPSRLSTSRGFFYLTLVLHFRCETGTDYKLNINIPAEMEEIFNHSGITQLIDQAYGILVKSFNDTQGKPLTYEEIQNRVEAFKSDRGIPPGITITEIISLLKQIKKSEKAGLIYTFKPTDYQNNITYPTFAIARYAEPYPEVFFILPFNWSSDL